MWRGPTESADTCPHRVGHDAGRTRAEVGSSLWSMPRDSDLPVPSGATGATTTTASSASRRGAGSAVTRKGRSTSPASKTAPGSAAAPIRSRSAGCSRATASASAAPCVSAGPSGVVANTSASPDPSASTGTAVPAHLVNPQYLYRRVTARPTRLTRIASSAACANYHRVHAPGVGRNRRRRVAAATTARSWGFHRTLSPTSRSNGFQDRRRASRWYGPGSVRRKCLRTGLAGTPARRGRERPRARCGGRSRAVLGHHAPVIGGPGIQRRAHRVTGARQVLHIHRRRIAAPQV